MGCVAKGYCVHHQFGSFRLPVPVQNALFRDFCRLNQFQFGLSINEIFGNRENVNLIAFLRDINRGDISTLLVCSLNCFSRELVNEIFDLLDGKAIRVWSVFEGVYADRKFVEAFFKADDEFPVADK